MTDDESRPQPPSLHLEIPIEPLPTEPLVPRPAPRPEPAELPGGVDEPTVEVAWAAPQAPPPGPDPDPTDVVPALESQTPPPVEDPAATPAPPGPAPLIEPERGEAGPGALRPETPRPAPSPRPKRPGDPPSRFQDRRHPIRASLGLIVLVVFGSLALAAAIGLAIAVIAFAVRQSVG